MTKLRTLATVLLLASATFFAVSCDKGSGYIPDDDVPPHVTPPEPPVEVTPTYPKADGVIRMVSYNVGAFNKYTNSIEMIAKMMKELDADVVGMNEVDSMTTRTSRTYQVKALAEKMGNWHYYYARAMAYQGGAYGNALVLDPKYKLNGTHNIRIPKGSKGEPRSCGILKTDKFVYMATHLEVSDEAARLNGVKMITDWAKENYGNSDMPVILCGDMNCEPNDAPILQFKKDWTILSVPDYTYPSSPSKPATKCIDFIMILNNKAKYEFVKSAVPTVFQYGSVTQASDHLPIYVDIKLK